MKHMRRQQIVLFWKAWKENDGLRTIVSAALSLCVTPLYALYHGYLGIFAHSLWHGSICVFYLLLVAIRGTILLTEQRLKAKSADAKRFWRRRVFAATCALLLLLNIALIVPISLMVLLRKPVNMGLIPAIAMAAYTTYKVTMAILHMRRRKGGHALIRELRTINLIDAMVSVLTLQNTLIMVNANADEIGNMRTLAAISSAAIYLFIVLTTVRSFLNSRAKQNGELWG